MFRFAECIFSGLINSYADNITGNDFKHEW